MRNPIKKILRGAATALFAIQILCQGNHLMHKLNGKVAIDLVDNDKKKLLKGKIGLQLHAGEVMKVEFRNIRLKKLK